jgi:hypothetical protein
MLIFANMKNESKRIANRRKIVAMHHSKTPERLEFEENHDCYMLILTEEGMDEVIIDGETYYKSNKTVDSLTKVDCLNLDGKTGQIYNMMCLRARFNPHRRAVVYAVWLPKAWSDALQGDINSDMIKIIDKYKFKI